MDVDKAIKERHSVRKYTSRTPDWREIMKAIDAARLAPLAGNIPTTKFVFVTEEDKIRQLGEACQQGFVGTSKYILVVCSDKEQATRSYDEKGGKYCSQQAGAAIENFLLKITDLGLATCWIGSFVEEQVKRILEIHEEVGVEALFPIGYEMPPKTKQRPKPSLDAVLYFNKWKNKYMKTIREPEAD